MEKKYLQLRDIEAYVIAFNLSNYVWSIVINWDYFSRDTIGRQYTRAIDSISANIAEGFGRYGKLDKIKFYRYSFGSLKECFDWNEKSRIRKLISQQQYGCIFSELQKMPKAINGLIYFTDKKLNR